MLKLDSKQAIAADNITAGIRETGKYIGVITRAEKLVSRDKGTLGLGLSFKADSGQSADYLDIYHTKGDGEPLSGLKTVNAILCCTKTAQADEGPIKVEKWDSAAGTRTPSTVTGYPALMGKRIGFLLQKTIETNSKTGADVERLQIFGVFNAETELTASEIYAKASEPKKLTLMLDSLLAKPVRDNRKQTGSRPASSNRSAGQERFDDIPDDDIPF